MPAPARAAQLPDTSVTYQANATHTGEVPLSLLQPPLVRLWTRPDLGWTSYPVVADGLVVVAKATGSAPGATIVALDAETGETGLVRAAGRAPQLGHLGRG